VSRYEALFELAGVINRSVDIESVGETLARRLKYIADVHSWRYVCLDGDPQEADGSDPAAIVVDGHQGRAQVLRATATALSRIELELWSSRKTCILSGDAMRSALEQIPRHLAKADLEQISVNTLVDDGKTRALFLFCKRRRPFTELDLKCLAMVCAFFHSKIHVLWEQRKLRKLELAYLEQDIALRQSEKLATLGRLSAGMAHELNNPAAAARQGAEHLKSSIARLEQARFALGAAGLSSEQHELIARLEEEAEEREKKPVSLDPLSRSDLEQEVEDWLERIGVHDPWEHASTLVTVGFCAAELEGLTKSFDSIATPVVVDYLSSKVAAHTLLREIGQGTRRIVEIVRALKGYSFMDRAPIQSVDVREGLNDTLTMLSSRLREGIKLELDLAGDLPEIQGYGSELNQVWTNIIDNAISAMAGKGRLQIHAHGEDGGVVVEITDSGPGIAAEAQGKVFDPFFTTKAPGEGAGLGLNVSHGIVVEKHGGEISVDSRPGATRFTVKLPIGGPTADGAGASTPPQRPS